MAHLIPEGEPTKRYSGNFVIVVLMFFALLISWAMFQYGSQALRMGPQAKELNRLMYERTLACAEPVDVVKCREASDAVDAYSTRMEEAVQQRATP